LVKFDRIITIKQPDKKMDSNEITIEPSISYLELSNQLKDFSISFIYNTGIFSNSNKQLYIRPGWGVDSYIFAISAAYVTSSGSSQIMLPKNIDKTLVQYMEREKIISKNDAVYVNNAQDIYSSTQNKLYSIDDFGAEFDKISINSSKTYIGCNAKDSFAALTKSTPIRQVFNIEDSDGNILFDSLYSKETSIYFKLCNTETGNGIQKIKGKNKSDTYAILINTLNEYRKISKRHNLSKNVVLEKEIRGNNYCFCVFINATNTVSIVSIARQLVADDGVTYAGTELLDLTQENIDPINRYIKEYVTNVKCKYPDAFGYLASDYIMNANGSAFLYDPALRPTGFLPGALMKIYLEEKRNGEKLYIRNIIPLDFNQKNFPYSSVVKILKKNSELLNIINYGYGVLPWGYNKTTGKGYFIVITPNKESYSRYIYHIKALISGN